jgi:predicted AAA+ superfamily ATPase
MNKETIKKIIIEFHESQLPELIERDLDIDIETKKIVTLIGPRRSGKTFILFNIIKILENKGVDRKDIIYLNFEDPRIYPFTAPDINILIEAYKELYPERSSPYLFLDEVHEITDWERAVRYLDDKKKYKIFLTGSSSRLLSGEIATTLRGRTISYKISPFSFKEILKTRNIKTDNKIAYSQTRFSAINQMEEYMNYGGFPEVVLEKNERTKFRILQEYFNTIFIKDLIERYNIRNITFLKEMIKFLISNISNYFSISKYYRSTSQKYKLSKKTIMNYLSYLEDINFIYSVKKYSPSIRIQNANPVKVYCIDTGLRTATGFYTSEDLGRTAENMVFIKLQKLKNLDPLIEFYYWKGKKQNSEVDFVIKRGKNIKKLIQVSWIIENENTKIRELKGLLNAMKEFDLESGFIITKEYESIEEMDNKKIEFIPLWKWLIKK